MTLDSEVTGILLSMKAVYQKSYPLEELARKQTLQLQSSWEKGCFNFLLQRTENYFHNRKVSSRRIQIEASINKQLPMIDDASLLALYTHACKVFQKQCRIRFIHNGFQRTLPEKLFLNTLQRVILENPTFKYLESYPSWSDSKNFKMVVGTHVPDFVVFGLKHPGYSSLVIEIDGDSHSEKYSKDQLYYDHLRELGIFYWSVPNEKVTDQNYILKGLKGFFRQRSGPLDKQIQRNKRAIWCKTIACHMDLAEIDLFFKEHYAIELNLRNEAIEVIKLKDCPRKIKAEIKRFL